MYKCKYCGQEFQDKYKLSGHVTRCSTNPNNNVDLYCPHCNKHFTMRSSYTRHVKYCKSNINAEKYSTTLDKNQYSCKYCGKICVGRNSLRNHERLCRKNPERKLITYEKCGPIDGFNKSGTRIAWNKGKTKDTDERVLQYSCTLKTGWAEGKYKNKFSHHTEETKHKISAIIKNICSTRNYSLCGKGKRGIYHNIMCQSSWELAYVIYQEDHNVTFERNSKGFSYIYKDEERTYYPDFYLPDSNTYVEIKGYYDSKTKSKVEQFDGNLVVLQLSEMKPILEYVENKYGKDFTRLYDIHYS